MLMLGFVDKKGLDQCQAQLFTLSVFHYGT